MHVPCGRSAQLGCHPERVEDGLGEILLERHLGARRDLGGEQLEPLVGVDPPLPGSRDRRTGLERQPARVREQMANGRAIGAGRVVEVDDALLDCDEGRERRRELRHRGPAKDVLGGTVLRGDTVGPHDGRRGVRRLPVVDLAKGVHGRGY